MLIIKPARLSKEHNTKYSQTVVHLFSPFNRREETKRIQIKGVASIAVS